MPIVQVYLVALIIAGLATLLYIFFSDMAEGIGEVSPFLDPAVDTCIHNICSGLRLYIGTCYNVGQWPHFGHCTCHCFCTRSSIILICPSSTEIGGSVARVYG